MVIAANDPARKSYFPLPNEVFDDPYFTKEKRVLSRLEALAWIARHVRWTDNCVLKRGQGSWSLAYLAQAWGWARPRVQRFLKKLENMNILQLVRDKASDTAQTVISYLISITSADAGVKIDTDPIQERYSSDTNINTGNTGKKDSPYSPPEGDPDPEWQSAFEPKKREGGGAGPSETVPPDPKPTADAGSPPNSAAPPSRKSRSKRDTVIRAPLSESWQPSARTREWAKTDKGKDGLPKIGATDVQIDVQVEEFLAYFLFGNGRKATWSDWDKAFQNWMRRAKRFGQLVERKSVFGSVREREFCI